MNKFFIILGVALLVMLGVVWKSNNDSKARREALAQQIEQHKQEMLQYESERQAQKEIEAREKLEKAEARTKYNNQISTKQATEEKQKKDNEDQLINKEREEYDKFKEVLSKWMTQDNIASSTARIAAPAQVTELRKIKDELSSTSITGCLSGAKNKLLSAMDDEILMFVYFMQDDMRTLKERDRLKTAYLNKLAESLEDHNLCKKKYVDVK